MLRYYIPTISHRDLDTYLLNVGKFARTCSHFTDGSEVPMKYGDLMAMWIGILSIEQVSLRFDVNNNNILEVSELEHAYKVYENVVKDFIPQDFMKKRSDVVFWYIIKYQRIPDVENFFSSWRDAWRATQNGTHFGQFWAKYKWNSAKQKYKADRKVFAKLISLIVEYTDKTNENPYDCDALR